MDKQKGIKIENIENKIAELEGKSQALQLALVAVLKVLCENQSLIGGNKILPETLKESLESTRRLYLEKLVESSSFEMFKLKFNETFEGLSERIISNHENNSNN